MRQPSPGALAVVVIGIASVALVAVGAPDSRTSPASVPSMSQPAAPSAVSAAGFTLASTSVDLPLDAATFPAGPHAQTVNAQCTSCHSAAMVLSQPALSADQWKATVTKMREVYHAPLEESEIPEVLAYLTSLPEQTKAPTSGGKSGPESPAHQSGRPGRH